MGPWLGWRRRSLPLLFAVVCGLYYATCSLLIHRSFHSNGWDLGIIDQVLWNTAHGRWFEYSFRDISYVGDHWQPVLLALVPLKWLFAGPEALLVAQGLLLGAAVIPLHAGASALTGRQTAWAVVLAYAFGLGVAQAVSFDFHAEAFVPFLVFTSLWALATDRPVWFLSAALATLLTKEDAALATIGLCWIAWVAFGWRWLAAVPTGIAVVYAALVNAWLVPHYRGTDLNPLAERYGYLGESIGDIVLSLVTRPDLIANKLASGDALMALVILLFGVALLPLLAPRLLPVLALVTVPPLLSEDNAQPRLELQYLLVPATMALTLAVLVLREHPGTGVGRLAPKAYPLLLAVSAVGLFAWRAPLPATFATDWDRFDVDHHAQVSKSIVNMIPRTEAVSAQSAFVPHLSERTDIFQFPRVLDARYVVVDRYGPVPSDDLTAGYAACLDALPRLGFDVVREDDGITLWRKVRPAQSVPDVPQYCSGQGP